MNSIEPLIGGHIDFITFGIAHFQIQISTDGEAFSISTSADVSCEVVGSARVDFREEKNSSALTALVGAKLLGLVVHDLGRGTSLIFDDNRQIRAWWPDKVYDNLFIVRRAATTDWWVIE